MIKPKAKIYIDGANIFYTQKQLQFSIDWVKMIKYLSESYDIIETRYYVGVKNDDEKIKKYLKYLDSINITPVTKPLKSIRINSSHVLAKSKN